MKPKNPLADLALNMPDSQTGKAFYLAGWRDAVLAIQEVAKRLSTMPQSTSKRRPIPSKRLGGK